MSMKTTKTILSACVLCLMTTHCAAQSTSLVPSSLSSANQSAFREIARDMSNPCVEETLQEYATLEALLDAGKTCHEAYILSSEIEFFLTHDVDKLQTKGIVKDEAKHLLMPVELNLENRPRLGEASAPVEIVLFSDFQCPFCARAATTVHKVYSERPDAVSIVFKQMPLTSIHPYAAAASLVSVFAAEKGKFWEVHDQMFSNQKELSPTYFEQILKSLGAETDDLFDPINGQKYGVVVIEDIEDARKAGVEGTPSFYINGVAIESGGNYERLMARVNAELNAPEPASAELRKKAREKALMTCPYPGHEEIYALLSPSGRAELSMFTNSVLCPCPGSSQTLHDCTIEATCENADALIDHIITRINEKTDSDQLLGEIETIVQRQRTQMPEEKLPTE